MEITEATEAITSVITRLRADSPRATARMITIEDAVWAVEKALKDIERDGWTGEYILRILGGFVANKYKHPPVGDELRIFFSVDITGKIEITDIAGERCVKALTGRGRRSNILRHGGKTGRVVKSWR